MTAAVMEEGEAERTRSARSIQAVHMREAYAIRGGGRPAGPPSQSNRHVSPQRYFAKSFEAISKVIMKPLVPRYSNAFSPAR